MAEKFSCDKMLYQMKNIPRDPEKLHIFPDY